MNSDTFKESWISFRLRRIVAPLVLLFLIVVAICALQRLAISSSHNQGQRSSQPPKVSLNGEELGTTDDLSKLDARFTDLFETRKKYRVFSPGTGAIKATVYVQAETSVRVSDLFKVVKALYRTGASPVLIPTRYFGSNVRPDPLLLMVSVGNLSFDISKLPAAGIKLETDSLLSGQNSLQDVPKGFIDVDMSREGEYIMDGVRVEPSALREKLKATLRRSRNDYSSGYIIHVFVGDDSLISYGSLAPLAQAASEAGAKGLLFFSPAGRN